MGTKYNELFYQRQQYSSLRAAEEILPYVLKLTGATSVVDVGCGLGTWLSVAAAAGARVRGFDGAYVDQDWLRIDRDDSRRRWPSVATACLGRSALLRRR